MVNNYPCFDSEKVKKEYSEKINSIFRKNKFKWEACPALLSPYVFVRPKTYTKTSQLNTEWHPFPNVAKVGISTKEGIARIEIIAHPQMNDSDSKKILEDKNYIYGNIRGQEKIFLLSKPLDMLEDIVLELKDIGPVLLKE